MQLHLYTIAKDGDGSALTEHGYLSVNGVNIRFDRKMREMVRERRVNMM